MQRDLVFLGIGPGHPHVEAELGPLCQMKVSGKEEEDPYIAFGSDDLARQFIAATRMEDQAVPRRLTDLEPKQVAAVRARSAIFFTLPEHVAGYLESRGEFDFSKHIVAVAEAERWAKQ